MVGSNRPSRMARPLSEGYARYMEDVRITTQLTTDRRKCVNQYIRGEKIGKGQHGEVFLCWDGEDNGREVALKVVKRSNPRDRIKLLRRNHQQTLGDKLPFSSTEHSIRKEIALMRNCRHANIVRLFEVIDDPQQDKIYIAMEYLSGGQVQWTNGLQEPILSVQQTRRILRDVTLGLEYLHHNGIIHRDIKPANLLWTYNRTTVKIIDFGVSHFSPKTRMSKFRKGNTLEVDESLFPEADLLRRIGTPSFLAPEVVWFSDYEPTTARNSSAETLASGCSCDNSLPAVVNAIIPHRLRRRPPITKAIDIWALAVTFYCLLFGHTPFNVPESQNENAYHNEFVLYNQICTEDWSVKDTMGADLIPTGGRNPQNSDTDGFMVIRLLEGMLQKDPERRLTLLEVKRNSWVLRDIAEPDEWLRKTTPSPDNVPTPCHWFRNKIRNVLSRHRR